jgi:hypothetical protein
MLHVQGDVLLCLGLGCGTLLLFCLKGGLPTPTPPLCHQTMLDGAIATVKLWCPVRGVHGCTGYSNCSDHYQLPLPLPLPPPSHRARCGPGACVCGRAQEAPHLATKRRRADMTAMATQLAAAVTAASPPPPPVGGGGGGGGPGEGVGVGPAAAQQAPLSLAGEQLASQRPSASASASAATTTTPASAAAAAAAAGGAEPLSPPPPGGARSPPSPPSPPPPALGGRLGYEGGRRRQQGGGGGGGGGGRVHLLVGGVAGWAVVYEDVLQGTWERCRAHGGGGGGGGGGAAEAVVAVEAGCLPGVGPECGGVLCATVAQAALPVDTTTLPPHAAGEVREQGERPERLPHHLRSSPYPSSTSPQMEVLLGTYSGHLLGYAAWEAWEEAASTSVGGRLRLQLAPTLVLGPGQLGVEGAIHSQGGGAVVGVRTVDVLGDGVTEVVLTTSRGGGGGAAGAVHVLQRDPTAVAQVCACQCVPVCASSHCKGAWSWPSI